MVDQHEEELHSEDLESEEKEVLTEVGDDDLRDQIAEEMGLDPDKQSDLLDKLVEREQSSRKRLSKAIEQKRKWREKADQTSKNSGKPESGKPTKQDSPDVATLVSSEVAKVIAQRDLESLSLPDEIKTEVQEYAKFKGISIREAAQAPYILAMKQEHERKQRIEAATPKRGKKGTYTREIDPEKPLNSDDFKTANGGFDYKAWDEAKAARERVKSQK